MTIPTQEQPAPFTRDDYAARMGRVVDDAAGAGLNGVIVAPGPDLVWLTGYRPTAITERLTMLVLAPEREPTLVVPALERPDAEAAAGAGALLVHTRSGRSIDVVNDAGNFANTRGGTL